MEFVYKNYIDTTGSFSVDSNTLTVINMINKDFTRQYVSDGFNDDLTTTTITYSFDETTSVGRIALMDHNFKDFTVYYNGVTASTFTISGDTTVSDFSSNSYTSQYFTIATPIDCTSVSIDILSTQNADAEKALGYFFISRELVDFNRIPSSKNYKPIITPKQSVHKMSDGGVKLNTVSDKWGVDIKFKYLGLSFRNELKTVWDLKSEFAFIAFPTTTSWDEIFFHANWQGAFEFYRYSDDAINAGFEGRIRLKEVPW